MERSEKPASQAPLRPRQGSRFSRCEARPSELASASRVKSATLARPSFGWLRVQGREGAISAPGAGADLGAGSGAAEVAVGGGVALAAEVRAGRALTRWPYGELCWPADWP